MSNKIFLLAWDSQGLETVLDLTDLEYNIMWDELKRTEDSQVNVSRANLNKILSVLLGRAQDRGHEDYEIYVIQTTDSTERDIWEMFINDPEGSKATSRENGFKFYSASSQIN